LKGVLIGLYIGKQGLESTCGAAASIVVVLIWVYYSAQLVCWALNSQRLWAALRLATNGASLDRGPTEGKGRHISPQNRC
jgi:hypothetical protein